MAYLKPQSPLQEKSGGNYFYPVTTIDQIIVDENYRLNEYFIIQGKEISSILLVANWLENDSKYSQSITIEDLSESYNVEVKIEYTDNLEKNLLINESASCVSYALQDDNTVIFYCLNNKPKYDIPIILEVNI